MISIGWRLTQKTFSGKTEVLSSYLPFARGRFKGRGTPLACTLSYFCRNGGLTPLYFLQRQGACVLMPRTCGGSFLSRLNVVQKETMWLLTLYVVRSMYVRGPQLFLLMCHKKFVNEVQSATKVLISYYFHCFWTPLKCHKESCEVLHVALVPLFEEACVYVCGNLQN